MMDQELFKIRQKLIFGGIFDFRRGDILVCINDIPELISGEFKFPGGMLNYNRRMKPVDERTIPLCLATAIKKDTMIPVRIVRPKIQPMSAVYNAYNSLFSVEYSAIIIGSFSRDYQRKGVYFVGVEDFIQLLKDGKISSETLRLGLRMFASRDCINQDYRKIAGAALRKIHFNNHSFECVFVYLTKDF